MLPLVVRLPKCAASLLLVALIVCALCPVSVSAGGLGLLKRNSTDVKVEAPLKPSSARKAPPPQPAPSVNYTVVPTGVLGAANSPNGKDSTPSSKGSGTLRAPLPAATELPHILSALTHEKVTDANFTTLLEGIWLVQLYAPWCPYSKKLQPIWPDIVRNVHAQNATVRFAKIDATVDTKAGAFLEIKGYPTIKFIQNGSVWTYRDQLVVDQVLNFVNDGWRQQLWYNRPKSFSIWFKVQLELFNTLMNYKFFWEEQIIYLRQKFNSAFVWLGILGATLYFLSDKRPETNLPAAVNGGEIVAPAPEAAPVNMHEEVLQQEQFVVEGEQNSKDVDEDAILKLDLASTSVLVGGALEATSQDELKCGTSDEDQHFATAERAVNKDAESHILVPPATVETPADSANRHAASVASESESAVEALGGMEEEGTTNRDEESTVVGDEMDVTALFVKAEEDDVPGQHSLPEGSDGTMSDHGTMASFGIPGAVSDREDEGALMIAETIEPALNEALSVDTRSIRTYRSEGSPSSMFEHINVDYLELEEEDEDVQFEHALINGAGSLPSVQSMSLPIPPAAHAPAQSLPSPASFVQSYELDYLEIEEEEEEEDNLTTSQTHDEDINSVQASDMMLYASFSSPERHAKIQEATPKPARDSGIDLDRTEEAGFTASYVVEEEYIVAAEPMETTSYTVEEEFIVTAEATEEVWFVEGEEVVEEVVEVFEGTPTVGGSSPVESDGPATPSTGGVATPISRKPSRVLKRPSNLSLRFKPLECDQDTQLFIPTTPEPRSPSRLLSPTAQIPVFVNGYANINGQNPGKPSGDQIRPTSPGRFNFYGDGEDVVDGGRFLYMAGR